jgi:hypothetical protein
LQARLFFFIVSLSPVSVGLSRYQTHDLTETAGAGEFLAGAYLRSKSKGFKGM